jgi:hypothetical protein
MALRLAALLVSLLLARLAAAADPLPIEASRVLDVGSASTVFSVDLGTLPTRPVLIVEAIPDAAHPDMWIEIEVTDYDLPPGGDGSACPNPSESNRVLGRRLERVWYQCQPAGGYPGSTASVIVRVPYFGYAGAPATVTTRIRGVTRPPTATLQQQVSGLRRIVVPASKDTVLYEDAPAASNGGGSTLWAGVVTQSALTGLRRHSLVAFDVAAEIPTNATVEQASLALQVVYAEPTWTTQTLDIRRVAPRPSGSSWQEGDYDQPGDEFFGSGGFALAADWLHRSSPLWPWPALLWSTPGGDPIGSPLLQFPSINSPRALQGTSASLTAAVQNMVSTGNSSDGFVLSAGNTMFPFSRRGLQIASREYSTANVRPQMTVDYTIPGTSGTGEIWTNVMDFVDEGQNFRWIYDLDQDDVYVSPAGGICTVVSRPPGQSEPLPYSYAWGGAPGFTGVDCCSWRIESEVSDTIGTGQALFYHNLDPYDPANDPTDLDADGLVDICDNCPNTPNGPLVGTCASGPRIGLSCESNQACALGGSCDLWQQDLDGNGVGNACPEPGVAVGLAAGLVALAGRSRALARRRRD